MTLYLPKEPPRALRAPAPAVLLIHGGSWFFGSSRQLDWYGRRLAEHGYIAGSIDYRMMPGHGFPDCLFDCKDAVRWLRVHSVEYGVDPDRIAVLGNSAGGQLAALLATTSPKDGLEGNPEPPEVSSAVQAAVVLYGVADLTYYQSPNGFIKLGGFTDQFMRRFVTKSQPEVPNPYERASPITYASSDTCPVLFVHGIHDHFVPYSQAQNFHDQLARLGVPTRLITVPYGHAFDFLHRKARENVFVEILGFLDRYLRPEPVKQ